MRQSAVEPTDNPTTSSQRNAAWRRLSHFPGESRRDGETLAKAVSMRLRGSRLLAAKRGALTRAVYRSTSRVAAVSLLVPHELCWASGFLPFGWEMFASLLASEDRVAEVCNRGKEQTPRCSFLDTLKGAYVEGMLPKPDISVSSSAYCAGVGTLFEELAGQFSAKHLHIDIPVYPGAEATEFLGRQLQRLFVELCSRNGINPYDGEARLRQAIRLSVTAQKEYFDMSRIRRQSPELNLALEPLLWHFLFFPFWGCEEGLEICRTLKEDVIAEVEQLDHLPAESIPLAVFSLYPYGRTDVWRRLTDCGVHTTFEGVNWLRASSLPAAHHVDNLPIERLFAHLAINLIDTPMRGGHIQAQTEEVVRVVKAHGARGMLVFSHDQCQMISSRLTRVEESLGRNALPVCVLNGDCILGVPSGPAGLRLGSFLSSLRRREAPRPRTTAERSVVQLTQRLQLEHAIGVDFGSGFSKYVVLDRDDGLSAHGTIPSGIDYPTLLARILSEVSDGPSSGLAVAGVGSDNPAFQGLAELQTTEINALITAVRHLFADRESLLVVDIGTQDVKVLHFSAMDREPWCATNKSCGAGTGSVLVQVLERWQQSEPEMSFETLDRLAFEARRGEPINTTCGIFAVTHVVSSLVQADDERRREILRGLYTYIAAQATRHFPPALRSGGSLLVVGGLAGHHTLQQVFADEGFELLDLPNGLSPQHVVALGAALSLREVAAGASMC